MKTGVVGGREEVFIVYEFLHVVGKAHIEDIVRHGLVDFLPQSFAGGLGVYVQGTEFGEVGLDVAFVP